MKDYVIVVDSREKRALRSEGVIKSTLKTGDYSILGFENKIAIERKSPIDLFGTLTSSHKRFKAELVRAQKLEYFAIIIDSSLSDIIKKSFKGSKYSKIKGLQIARILFTQHFRYGPQIFFSGSRNESKLIIENLFEAFYKHKRDNYSDFKAINEVK